MPFLHSCCSQHLGEKEIAPPPSGPSLTPSPSCPLFPGPRPLWAGPAADRDQHDGTAWRTPFGFHPPARSAVSPTAVSQGQTWIPRLQVAPSLHSLSWGGSLGQGIRDAQFTQQICMELEPGTWRSLARPIFQRAAV